MKAGPRAHPIWISADAAASEQGDLRWQFFSPSEAGNLRGFLAWNEELKSKPANAQEHGASDDQATDLECPIALATSDQDRIDPKPNDSLSHLAEQAIAIYSGRIESISQGFFDGIPSSLLRVRTMEAFRSSPLIDEEEVLIPYPYARFKIGDRSFCGGSSAIYRPAVEDRVLVFVYDPPLNAARNLVFPRSPEIFFQGSEGHLVSPDSLKTDKYIAVADSLADLEELLRSGPIGKEPERERTLPNGTGNVP
jgi:hypothetical protein